MATRPLWIDTDAGTDDAVAIIMAMKSADVDIIGISTSGGNVPLECVVQNVLYIKELCHSASPVYKGEAQPLERVLDTADFIHGKDGLGDIGLPLHGRKADEGAGAAELVKAIQSNPDLEIVCLGPLTNIALAEKSNPGLLNKVKRIFIMGGLVELPGNVTPLAEYNIWADPEAAQLVLSTDAKITMIGWDTTLKSAGWGPEEIAQIRALKTPLADFAMDIQGVRLAWMERTGEEKTLLLADALAMAVVLRPDCVVDAQHYVMSIASDADDEALRGVVIANLSDKPSDVFYVSEVDASMYIDMVKEALS